MMRLKILTAIAVVASFITFLAGGGDHTRGEAGSVERVRKLLVDNKQVMAPKKNRRPPDQTFLTYPEWFLVHSPAEQAEHFKKNTATSFPYNQHTGQLWASYGIVFDHIKKRYEFNSGYHVMIMVIGVSTTVEYFGKTVYENLIGVLTDTSPGEKQTAEDEFNGRITAEYVAFIRHTPWYEFDFRKRLNQLYYNVPVFGSNFIRKAERRYFLTTELLVKAGYGWLIKKGTKAAYETPLLDTVVVATGVTGPVLNDKQVKVIKKFSSDKYLLSVPRYGDFNFAINRLAKQGVQFEEIAGNRSAILITLVSPNRDISPKHCEKLFSQTYPTQSGNYRIGVAVKVAELHKALKEFQKNNLRVEHIYDF